MIQPKKTEQYYPPHLRVIPTDLRVPLCTSGTDEGLKDLENMTIYEEGDF